MKSRQPISLGSEMVTANMKPAAVLTGSACKSRGRCESSDRNRGGYVDNVMLCIVRDTASLGFWIQIPHSEDFRQQYQTIGTTMNYTA
jgi:hypothetical protein